MTEIMPKQKRAKPERLRSSSATVKEIKNINLSHVMSFGKRCANETNLPEDMHPEFSLGWVSCFCRRHGFKSFKSYGESGDADVDALPAALMDIQPRLSRFIPKDIFNMDETGLFFRMMPDRNNCFAAPS